MRRYFPLVSSVISLALIVLMFQSYQAGAQSDLTNFDTVRISNDLTVVDDTTTEDFSVTDLATIADLAVTEQMTLSDDLIVAGDQINTPGTVIVVSDGSTITPLSAYQPLSSTANTGTNVIGGCTAGKTTTMSNQFTTTITISDSGNLRLAGNMALGQYDTLTVRCHNGTLWLEVARANN
jgi:hypothetical protein